MFALPTKTWLLFFAWMAVGLGFYFLYGFRNSRLRNGPTPVERPNR
jgi:APA family basic amino acid/polyamine antiporter